MKNIIFAILSLLLTCEFLVYYIVLLGNCGYPGLKGGEKGELKALFLADTHLLGSRNGHWFDKLRREWQMHRSFQTALSLFAPDVVFILGDVFDEGKWCSQAEFVYYRRRFHSLFYVPEETKMFAVQGNHDIGFHFATHPVLDERFKNAFEGTQSVRKLTLQGNVFVLVNSMALDRTDACFLCKEGERQLNQVNASLRPEKEPRPILLQHFPLYRSSDAECEEMDAELEEDAPFREGYDTLSQSSTEYLLDRINPRLVLTGHTHHGCHLQHSESLFEITVPSFSWRNRNTPSFYLANISPQDYSLQKCVLPPEDSVMNLYCLGITLIIIYIIYSRGRRRYRWSM
eukprot:TRINITY_DN6130_c0_g1_i1.p1 TRINITY_DN6130_c0_g1~~TRINITY_DN6130_c0_g1_i1.p1  ORF type:complete len:344 (-),score=66.63 TRINITY_DN6130_c0_g1_i1:961-1992(-)